MQRILYLLPFLLLASAGAAQQISITRGSVDVAVGPSTTPGPSTNYKYGAGPGQELNTFNLGNFATTDFLFLRDIYLFTRQSGGCQVDAATVAYRVYPVSDPSVGNASTLSTSFVRNCGPSWRFTSPACVNGDREFGTSAGTSIGVGLANFANQGVIALELTWSVTAVNGPAACMPTAVTATGFFTVGAAPLPVTLTRLSAKPEGSANAISWTAASETALSHYVVERATRDDLRDFTSVERLAARGTTTGTEAVYAAYDATPARVSFYRLRAVDTDGSIEYSDVVAVRRDGAAPGVKAYPNPSPAGSAITVEFPVSAVGEETAISIVDASGREVYRAHVAGDRLDLPTGRLPAGVYAVTARTATGARSTRLVVE